MFDKLLEEFRINVHDRSAEVDPNDAHNWYDLAYGWGLAKGLLIVDAHRFAGQATRLT